MIFARLSIIEWDIADIVSYKSKNGNTFRDRVVVLHFGKAHPFGTNTSVSAGNDYNVVITLFNDTLDQLPLRIIGSRKEFHS